MKINLAAISSFYDFLAFHDKDTFNPVPIVRRQLERGNGNQHSHKIISIEEAAKLIRSCIDIRDKTMLMLLFKTGMRRNELLSLDVDDIDFKNQSIKLIPKGKRGRGGSTTVYFDDGCAKYLKRWIEIWMEEIYHQYMRSSFLKMMIISCFAICVSADA